MDDLKPTKATPPRKRRAAWAAGLLALWLLSGCGAPAVSQPQTASFFAMNTVMDFTIYGDPALLQGAEAQVTDLEQQVSVTEADSALRRINQTGAGTLTGAAGVLMDQALALCGRTGGALDLSIYPVVRAWGFTTGAYQVPAPETLEKLLAQVDHAKIGFDRASGQVTLPAGMEIDLGSVAKGYAGGLAARYLREQGVTSALLNLGGNVQTIGGKPDGTPWNIALRDPNGGTPAVVLSVRDQAVVTSGGYERYFTQDGTTYWHIMDPATGRPADSGLRSVTVVGEDGLLCDGLSTALFVMGLEKAAALWRESQDFEAVFVTDQGEIYLTDGLRFSLTEDHQNTAVHRLTR